MCNYYSLNDHELSWLNQNQPGLKYFPKDNIIKGILRVNRTRENETIDEQYNIEIHLIRSVNSLKPIIFEVGGKISQYATELNIPLNDLHINKDGSLCLCIYEEEKEYLPNGFILSDYIENLVEPFFYWIEYYKIFKEPPWGEYAHDFLGYMQLYNKGKIVISELKKKAKEMNYDILSLTKLKGHHQCPCNSGKILRNCHPDIYAAIYKLKQEDR